MTSPGSGGTPSPTGESSLFQSLKKSFFPAFRVALAIAIAIFINQLDLDYIEAFLYDMRVRIRPSPQVTNNIVTVIVDNKSVERLGRQPNIADHAKMIEALNQGHPRFIIYAIRPEKLDGTYSEQQEFVKAQENSQGFFVASEEVELRGEHDKLRLPPPFENVSLFPGIITADSIVLAKDSVTRRTMLTYQNQTMLHPYVASSYNPAVHNIKGIRGVFNFLDTDQVYIDMAPSGSFPRYSLADVATGEIKPDTFKDKIVIIGRDLDTSSRNFVMTPYSRKVQAMNTAEMHANMIDSLIRNAAPIEAPRWLDVLVTMIISIITIHVVLRMKPTYGLMIMGATFVAYSMIALLAFWPFGIWVGMAQPYLAIFLCYYFFIPYRLIVENRKSWEYYQKNKLLTQVEELKNNFISMMSHDLKTPLARIQGMIDIILRDKNPLSHEQRQAVLSVQKSSEDLLQFISSILNFGRIESQGIQLHLQSRDINSIIEEVVHKLEFQAQQKGISVVTELEPLFSIKVDSDLIRQVISNLIENAIKYSPDESKILVSTEENNDHIVIQVADQGMGIPADELANIFMKFFRSRDAKSSPIKGSGLGLYLSKYFVELHKGRLSVESSVGIGSTFTVELPVNFSNT